MRRIALASLPVMIVLLVFTVERFGSIKVRASSPFTTQPFTQTTEATVFRDISSGTWKRTPGVIVDRATMARESDGTTVVYSGNPSIPYDAFFIRKTTADGQYTDFYPSLHAQSTGKTDTLGLPSVAEPLTDTLTDPPPDCLFFPKEEQITNRKLYWGVEVIEVVESRDALHDRVTELRAPSLACWIMAYTYEYQDESGAYLVGSQMDTVNLQLGHPDPKLMTLPTDWPEISPGDVLRKMAAATVGGPTAEIEKYAEEADKAYAFKHPR